MYDVFGLHEQGKTLPWALFVLPVSCALLASVTILFYKRRKLQINLGYLTIFAIVLIYVFGAFFLWDLKQNYLVSISYTIVCTFPFIALIFEFLAIRGIKKDEKLIRSLNRLRP